MGIFPFSILYKKVRTNMSEILTEIFVIFTGLNPLETAIFGNS